MPHHFTRVPELIQGPKIIEAALYLQCGAWVNSTYHTKQDYNTLTCTPCTAGDKEEMW